MGRVVQVRDLREDSLVQVRDFYGSLRVTETHWPPEAVTTRILYHGTIEHGTQLFGGDLRKHLQATTRRTRRGPRPAILRANQPPNIAVVGLGAGTLAVYGEPGDTFTFFEINPAVERLAGILHLSARVESHRKYRLRGCATLAGTQSRTALLVTT